jgi:hypothetical protein
VSTDETWTPSVDGQDTDDVLDMDDNGGIWQEIPIKPQDFPISCNKVDSDLKAGFEEEVRELKKDWESNLFTKSYSLHDKQLLQL